MRPHSYSCERGYIKRGIGSELIPFFYLSFHSFTFFSWDTEFSFNGPLIFFIPFCLENLLFFAVPLLSLLNKKTWLGTREPSLLKRSRTRQLIWYLHTLLPFQPFCFLSFYFLSVDGVLKCCSMKELIINKLKFLSFFGLLWWVGSMVA